MQNRHAEQRTKRVGDALLGFRLGSGAFPRINQLKPAPGIHWLMFGLHPPFVHFVVIFGSPALCRAEDSIVHLARPARAVRCHS
jgi:hypothetical protein